MNCKPGDLAIFRAYCVNAGCLVEVLDQCPPDEDGDDTRIRLLSAGTDKAGLTHAPGYVGMTQDRYLSPIRDNDGIDQTLEWKSVPRLPAKEIT